MIPPCLTLSNIRYVSRVKWSNPGKGVAPSLTLLKREPFGHPQLRSPTLQLIIYFVASSNKCYTILLIRHIFQQDQVKSRGNPNLNIFRPYFSNAGITEKQKYKNLSIHIVVYQNFSCSQWYWSWKKFGIGLLLQSF